MKARPQPNPKPKPNPPSTGMPGPGPGSSTISLSPTNQKAYAAGYKAGIQGQEDRPPEELSALERVAWQAGWMGGRLKREQDRPGEPAPPQGKGGRS